MLPGAKRMVVGHTIQEAGINAACGGRVFRIDVGLSRGCGDGEPQVPVRTAGDFYGGMPILCQFYWACALHLLRVLCDNLDRGVDDNT
jgi:hypothetical protein